MLYTSPRPPFNVLKDFYSNSVNMKFWDEYIYPSSKEVRRDKIFIPRVEGLIKLCEDYSIETNSVLEVGAGYGLFLEEIQKKNIFQTIIGVEASDPLYSRSKQLGFDVYNGIFEELNINKRFNQKIRNSIS